jgi:hypothetical protein
MAPLVRLKRDADASSAPLRYRLGLDGAETTAYVHRRPLAATRVRVAAFETPAPLVAWCRRRRVADAIVGGFFIRPGGAPLGDLWMDGAQAETIPFHTPWDRERSCVHSLDGGTTIAPRRELPRSPEGDLLQAGPLLVRDGQPTVEEGGDAEGFAAGSEQFDSDITVGRYPRAALGIGGDSLLAVVCDGRGEHDAGLTLAELAVLMAELGAELAINLDGGGSTSLVCGGTLVNRPREEHGLDLPGGRPISTALALLPAG